MMVTMTLTSFSNNNVLVASSAAALAIGAIPASSAHQQFQRWGSSEIADRSLEGLSLPASMSIRTEYIDIGAAGSSSKAEKGGSGKSKTSKSSSAKSSKSSKSVTTITLGQDVDYPPYAFETADGELAGFGKDVADGMTALCDDLDIVVVKESWSECWTSDGGGSLGASVADGTIDGCMTYTHTQGVRDDLADFSDAILLDNKSAGLMTLLDGDGDPRVNGMDDLSGRTIIDVGGWAPTADGLGFVTNQCTDEGYADDYTLLVADGAVANDVAMQMLRDEEGEAVFIYASQAHEYAKCTPGAAWDCTLWEGLGTDYAYVQTGQRGYVVNGTTLALSRKGSGIREILRPCMAEFMATRAYYDICVKHGLVGDCYPNEYFEGGDVVTDPWDLSTKDQTGDCSDGYCPCSA